MIIGRYIVACMSDVNCGWSLRISHSMNIENSFSGFIIIKDMVVSSTHAYFLPVLKKLELPGDHCCCHGSSASMRIIYVHDAMMSDCEYLSAL